MSLRSSATAPRRNAQAIREAFWRVYGREDGDKVLSAMLRSLEANLERQRAQENSMSDTQDVVAKAQEMSRYAARSSERTPRSGQNLAVALVPFEYAERPLEAGEVFLTQGVRFDEFLARAGAFRGLRADDRQETRADGRLFVVA